MKRIVLVTVLSLFLFQGLAFSQVVEQGKVTRIKDRGIIQPRKLIDTPTAGLLPRGSFDFDIRIYPGGGVINTIDIGLMNRFMLGVSYGGARLISEETPVWNPRPEIAAKIRVINESYVMPGIAVGYDGQGIGPYYDADSLKRYQYKSKGFYAVASKGYLFGIVPIGFHVGMNYSLEGKDQDKNISLFMGSDIRFNESLGALLEYDLGTNDNKSTALGRGRGYLNLGLQWTFSDRLSLELDLRNMLQNTRHISQIGREFRIIYVEFF
ncbi:MAG TPA: hypothetical protein VMT04_05275 [Terriglobales bacterium]|nr:hypothetical protein [Terriglobales bacterium]